MLYVINALEGKCRKIWSPNKKGKGTRSFLSLQTSSLFVHMSSEVTSSAYILACPTCRATGFSSKSKLRGHLKVKHDVDLPSMSAGRPTEQDTVRNLQSGENCYSCPSCTLVFKSIELVGAHLKDHFPSSTSKRSSNRSVKTQQWR
jgi:uncharacterized C2H2 Zn-finger protein